MPHQASGPRNWDLAIECVKSGGSLRSAARKYDVSRESLRRRVCGDVAPAAKPGRPRAYISAGHEEGVLEVILYRAKLGFCIDKAELRCIVREAALSHRRDTPSNFPNDKWMQRFILKHKEAIGYRRAQILDSKRAKCSTEEIVRYYYENLRPVLDGLQPQYIWNCDETGVCPQGRGGARVICPKGLKANTQRSPDRENVSIMGCINAHGDYIPPMFIFAGKRKKSGWLDGAVPGSQCATTESSNINGFVFFHWFKWFVGRIGDHRPQVLLLDGHFSHLTQSTLAYARDNQVLLFVLPAHTSHFLQPLDVGVFGHFKRHYERELSQFPLSHRGALPTKDDIAALTHDPFLRSFTPSNIQSAFSKTGIYPLNLEMMLGHIIGNKPMTLKATLPHHAAIGRNFDLKLTDRQHRKLAREGLSPDAINVVSFHMHTMVIPHSKKRNAGVFLNDSVSGGVLVTSDEMFARVQEKQHAKERKALETQERALKRQKIKQEKADNKKQKAAVRRKPRAKVAEHESAMALCQTIPKSSLLVVDSEAWYVRGAEGIQVCAV